MNGIKTFEEFIATQNIQVSFIDFVINLVFTAILSEILAFTYTKFGKGTSDKKAISNNFIYIAMTTMVIISVVKSSLALSLGLVGALSIVRFRTAIKDPEELAYLFLSIAIGLGLGANQRYITITGFILIVIVIIIKNRITIKEEEYNLFLVLANQNSTSVKIEEITNILKNTCQTVNMKRFEESNNSYEVVFYIKCDNFTKINQIKKELKEIDPDLTLSFSDINTIV